MSKEIDFLDWASKNGYSTTEVPMNIMEMILDFEKHVESKVKNLTIPRVVGRSEQLPPNPITDKEHKNLMKVLYPKDNSNRFRR